MSPNPTRRRRRARRESYAGLSGCREERACLASEPRAVVHPDVRGRSTTRGGFACEVWRVGVRDLPGSRARSPGLACEVSRVGVRDLPGWRARSPGLASEVSRVGVRGLPGTALTSSCTSRRVGRVHVLGVHGHAPMRDGMLCQAAVVIGARSTSPGPRSIGRLSSIAQGVGAGGVGHTRRRHWMWHRRPVHTAALPCSHAVLRVGWRSWADMDIAGRRYGHCRPWLWTMSGATLDIVGRGYGPCPAPPWTLPDATLDTARRHLGHCPTPPWTLPCRSRALPRRRRIFLSAAPAPERSEGSAPVFAETRPA